MAYDAKVIEVMIASPGDVKSERLAVREIIAEWNVLHSREREVVLLPLGWDTHSAPELGGRPQQFINDRLLKHADLVVGIFWTRLGTPTGKASSGTVEEVQEHHAAGKPVMLYFSEEPVALSSVDPQQYSNLQNFKAWALKEGLVESYDDLGVFKDKFRRQLQLILQGNPYLVDIAEVDFAGLVERGLKIEPPALSPEAGELLAAAAGSNGTIIALRTLSGDSIQAGSRQFGDKKDRRDTARWTAALEELHRFDFTTKNAKGDVHQLTHAGYTHADENSVAQTQ